MTREQANDYDEKRRAILDAAAALFAEAGYPAAQMKEIASACGASKSLIYHYFKSKDDVLFALLKEHVQETLSALEEIEDDILKEDRFRKMVEVYIRKSAQTRSRHIVAMNDVKYLSSASRKTIHALERKISRMFEECLHAIKPTLSKSLVGPYSMLLSGMLNWTDLWYRPSGALKPDELCDRIAALFLDGFARAEDL